MIDKIVERLRDSYPLPTRGDKEAAFTERQQLTVGYPLALPASARFLRFDPRPGQVSDDGDRQFVRRVLNSETHEGVRLWLQTVECRSMEDAEDAWYGLLAYDQALPHRWVEIHGMKMLSALPSERPCLYFLHANLAIAIAGYGAAHPDEERFCRAWAEGILADLDVEPGDGVGDLDLSVDRTDDGFRVRWDPELLAGGRHWLHLAARDAPLSRSGDREVLLAGSAPTEGLELTATLVGPEGAERVGSFAV